MAGSAPEQPPWPARVATPGPIHRTRSETAKRTGCQKSLSNLKNSTIFQFTVQFYGMEVVIMENKSKTKQKQESNNPDLFGFWFQGEWTSGSKGSSSHRAGAFPCRAISPLMRGRKAGHATGEPVSHGWLQGNFLGGEGGCSLHFWHRALRPGCLQYHTSMTGCPLT